MGQWFIGEERAKNLLDYALARLAMQAHRLEPRQYLLIRKFLEARIPLWVEERRGPLNGQGQPLLSEQGYKDFIKWWVLELTKPAAVKEEQTVNSKHWAEEAFNKKQVVGASALSGGAVEDALNALPTDVDFGPDRVANLIAYARENLANYLKPFRTSTNEQQINDIFLKLMASIEAEFRKWQADRSVSPKDPTSATRYADQVSPVGINQMDQIRRAVDEMMYQSLLENVVKPPAGSYSAPQTGWFDAYDIDPFAYTSGYKQIIPYEAFTSQFPLRAYDPNTYSVDPRDVGSSVGPGTTTSTFRNIYTRRADDIMFAASLIGPPEWLFKDVNTAKAAVEAQLQSYSKANDGIATTVNEQVVNEADYASAKAAFESYALPRMK